MNSIGDILINRKNVGKHIYNNVNVDKNLYNNVNVEELLRKINDAVDKPKAIGETLVKELNAPHNLRFYIKLAYEYPADYLFTCLALTNKTSREGGIKTTRAQFFYGIVRRQKK